MHTLSLCLSLSHTPLRTRSRTITHVHLDPEERKRERERERARESRRIKLFTHRILAYQFTVPLCMILTNALLLWFSWMPSFYDYYFTSTRMPSFYDYYFTSTQRAYTISILDCNKPQILLLYDEYIVYVCACVCVCVCICVRVYVCACVCISYVTSIF